MLSCNSLCNMHLDDLRTVDSEADILREFAPQIDASQPPTGADSSSDEDNDNMGLSSQIMNADVSDSGTVYSAIYVFK